MTTTGTFDMTQPVPPPPSARRLRRSRTDRIGAGVAGGLGEYFAVDPVIFRVLFATAAFFGGAGVLAYLIAWAAIPDQGTEHAVIDRWTAWLRARRVPFWLVAAAGAFVFWLIAFSWWAPGPFVPLIIVVIVLVAVLGQRAHTVATAPANPPAGPPFGPAPMTAPPAQPVDLSKDSTPESGAAPSWPDTTRQWLRESREARLQRRRRATPVTVATLVSFVVAMAVLAVIDAVQGIPLPAYFWVALAILGTGLVVGLVLRRASWSVALLLVPTVIGLVAVAGTDVSLSDGIGQKQWQPISKPAATYKLAFGQGVLDLRSLAPQTTPSIVRIDVAAGQVQILAPRTLNLRVVANVRFGDVRVDGGSFRIGSARSNGIGISRLVPAPASATGAPVTVDVHLGEGDVNIQHR